MTQHYFELEEYFEGNDNRRRIAYTALADIVMDEDIDALVRSAIYNQVGYQNDELIKNIDNLVSKKVTDVANKNLYPINTAPAKHIVREIVAHKIRLTGTDNIEQLANASEEVRTISLFMKDNLESITRFKDLLLEGA